MVLSGQLLVVTGALLFTVIGSVPSLALVTIDFLEELTQSILRANIEVNLGGFEAIVSKDLLQTRALCKLDIFCQSILVAFTGCSGKASREFL